MSTTTDRFRAALKEIAEFRLECGCVPCMGQCRTKEVLLAEIEGLVEIAETALRFVAKEVEENHSSAEKLDRFTRITRDMARSA